MATKDRFAHLTPPITGPFGRAEMLVPRDDDLDEYPQALLIGTDGTLHVIAKNSELAIGLDVTTGLIIPIIARRITSLTTCVVIGLFAG